MSVLKPKKVQSVEDWKKSYGFEDGPTGGYVPNMSEADELSWKAKLKYHTTPNPQVEIRKTFSNGVQLLLIVNLGNGYTYKYYSPTGDEHGHNKTAGINIHMSMNGPAQMTFDELNDFHAAVQEAKLVLEHHLKVTTSGK